MHTITSLDSGHGGQTKDTSGDEADGYDETIYPLDFEQAGQIVDDVSSEVAERRSYMLTSYQQMHDILVKPLPPGCRLTAIFDVSLSHSPIKLKLTSLPSAPVLSFWLRPGHVDLLLGADRHS